LLWREWWPAWRFSLAEFEQTAAAFDNADWVETVVHNYRYRLGYGPGDPQRADIAERLVAFPSISVPAITLAGGMQGAAPRSVEQASDGRITGPREPRVSRPEFSWGRQVYD
jgi:hypothetical protein